MTIRKAASRRAHALLAELAERFPAAFVAIDQPIDPRPLAIGLRHQIEAEVPAVNKRDLQHAFGVYCSRDRYRRVSVVGAERVGLDGQVTCQVTAEEVERGKAKWEAIRLIRDERKRRRRAADEVAKAKSKAVAEECSAETAVPAPVEVQARAKPVVLAPPVAQVMEKLTELDKTALRLAADWGVPQSRPSPRNRHVQKPFAVEVKRRRVVLTSRDRFEHGR